MRPYDEVYSMDFYLSNCEMGVGMGGEEKGGERERQ